MKRFIVFCITAFVCAAFASVGAQAARPVTKKTNETTTVAEREYKCTVTVYARGNRSTWPYENATVSGLTKNGFTKDFKTDSKGRATIIWYSNSDLKAIYVKGTGFTDTNVKFEGTFEDGGSYTFYIDA